MREHLPSYMSIKSSLLSLSIPAVSKFRPGSCLNLILGNCYKYEKKYSDKFTRMQKFKTEMLVIVAILQIELKKQPKVLKIPSTEKVIWPETYGQNFNYFQLINIYKEDEISLCHLGSSGSHFSCQAQMTSLCDFFFVLGRFAFTLGVLQQHPYTSAKTIRERTPRMNTAITITPPRAHGSCWTRYRNHSTNPSGDAGGFIGSPELSTAIS